MVMSCFEVNAASGGTNWNYKLQEQFGCRDQS